MALEDVIKENTEALKQLTEALLRSSGDKSPAPIPTKEDVLAKKRTGRPAKADAAKVEEKHPQHLSPMRHLALVCLS